MGTATTHLSGLESERFRGADLLDGYLSSALLRGTLRCQNKQNTAGEKRH